MVFVLRVTARKELQNQHRKFQQIHRAEFISGQVARACSAPYPKAEPGAYRTHVHFPPRTSSKSSAAAAAVLGSRAPLCQPLITGSVAPSTDAYIEDLAMEALNAAKAAGASYADVRIGRYRRQSISTRERQITGVSDNESYGIGVRTLVGGAWGFAATATMTPAGAQQAAQQAARLSRAAKSVQKKQVELAPTPAVKGSWRTPVTRDPVDVPIEEKVALLLAANAAAMKVPKIRFATSGLQALREEKTLATMMEL